MNNALAMLHAGVACLTSRLCSAKLLQAVAIQTHFSAARCVTCLTTSFLRGDCVRTYTLVHQNVPAKLTKQFMRTLPDHSVVVAYVRDQTLHTLRVHVDGRATRGVACVGDLSKFKQCCWTPEGTLLILHNHCTVELTFNGNVVRKADAMCCATKSMHDLMATEDVVVALYYENDHNCVKVYARSTFVLRSTMRFLHAQANAPFFGQDGFLYFWRRRRGKWYLLQCSVTDAHILKNEEVPLHGSLESASVSSYGDVLIGTIYRGRSYHFCHKLAGQPWSCSEMVPLKLPPSYLRVFAQGKLFVLWSYHGQLRVYV